MDATREAFRPPPQEPVRNAADASDERRYPLYLAERGIRVYWRLPNCGLTLRGARLAWTADGLDRDYGLDEIRRIRLQNTMGSGRDPVGICQIRFRDGRVITVYGGDDRGTSDPAQAEIYAAFVRDLHRRIPEEAARRIVFNAGITEGRFIALSVAAAFAALLFVGTPLVLLFFVPSTETLKVLGLLGAGAAFCWPMWKLWDNNRPRPYSPRDLPEDLVG
jgi:hypothetical protein